MVCPRLGTGNALLDGGKLSEKEKLYVGGVTDSSLACSTLTQEKLQSELVEHLG